MTADAGSSRSAGQNALSTGAVSGISRPLVMKLGRDGARLIAVDRDAAGVARSGSMTEGSLQVWRESMADNADSTMLAVRHALLALRQAGRGSIVTLRSLYRSKSKPSRERTCSCCVSCARNRSDVLPCAIRSGGIWSHRSNAAVLSPAIRCRPLPTNCVASASARRCATHPAVWPNMSMCAER